MLRLTIIIINVITLLFKIKKHSIEGKIREREKYKETPKKVLD